MSHPGTPFPEAPSAREILAANAYFEKLGNVTPDSIAVRRQGESVLIDVAVPAEQPFELIFAGLGNNRWDFIREIALSPIKLRVHANAWALAISRADNPTKKLYVHAICNLEDAVWEAMRRDAEFFAWLGERFPDAKEDQFRRDAAREL